jgi:hypothetical protein
MASSACANIRLRRAAAMDEFEVELRITLDELETQSERVQ